MTTFLERTEKTQYVLASPEQARRCLDEAKAWAENQRWDMFMSTRMVAISAVAEYTANLKGFTLYEANATYPKKAVA